MIILSIQCKSTKLILTKLSISVFEICDCIISQTAESEVAGQSARHRDSRADRNVWQRLHPNTINL